MNSVQKDLALAIDPSWRALLKEEFSQEYMLSLSKFLKEEREQFTIYPPAKDVFNSFAYSKLEETRVVLIGQDPYHGPNQAHGLCFSVQKGINPPPSLKNIYKELKEDLGINPPQHGCLIEWAKQGILLLNATLTVQQASPKSHHGKGWERFTDKVVELLAQSQEPLAFVLWGKSAMEKCANLGLDQGKHLVLSAAHPSPYSASHGFFGCKHFSKINHFLQSHGKSPIHWELSDN